MQFNKREVLELDGCHSKLLYDFLCHVLKGDLNTHLTRNEVLRELFDMGPVLVEDQPLTNKAAKAERASFWTEVDLKMIKCCWLSYDRDLG